MANEIGYKNPKGGTPSSVGSQIRTDYFEKKALIEARKLQFFGQLADVTSMPKNMGKTIKRYHYLPILDDANVNDQGIDAAGATTTFEVVIVITRPGVAANIYSSYYASAEGASGANALAAAKLVANDIFKNLKVFTTDYATTKAALVAAGWTFVEPTAGEAKVNAGNIYGSSKDVGTITSKLPALTENGGRVNRVGMKRIELEGSITKFGFFDEYTQESLDFDTDEELEMHITRELVNAAEEMTEDALQIDLLNGAGVVRFGGVATSAATITGEGANKSLITYNDLMRLAIDLDNNRCPKGTKIITGTRMVDTKTIDAARIMYIGSELIPLVKKMVDNFSNQAFIPVQQYSAGGDIVTGEIGSIDQFRIVVVPEMLHWENVGGTVTTNGGYREAGGKYIVYPMLVVGSESFTTIGFQTDGKTVKFQITHKKPGVESADRNDPYGETGFTSIKWYYGTMLLRPERIAVCKTIAEQ